MTGSSCVLSLRGSQFPFIAHTYPTHSLTLKRHISPMRRSMLKTQCSHPVTNGVCTDFMASLFNFFLLSLLIDFFSCLIALDSLSLFSLALRSTSVSSSRTSSSHSSHFLFFSPALVRPSLIAGFHGSSSTWLWSAHSSLASQIGIATVLGPLICRARMFFQP